MQPMAISAKLISICSRISLIPCASSSAWQLIRRRPRVRVTADIRNRLRSLTGQVQWSVRLYWTISVITTKCCHLRACLRMWTTKSKMQVSGRNYAKPSIRSKLSTLVKSMTCSLPRKYSRPISPPSTFLWFLEVRKITYVQKEWNSTWIYLSCLVCVLLIW